MDSGGAWPLTRGPRPVAGGIHEAAFAYWKGQIEPGSRSGEVVSSLDLFPTASALAGVPLPADRVYDGRDMSDVLLQPEGKSLHEVRPSASLTCTAGPSFPLSISISLSLSQVLFFYGGAKPAGQQRGGGPSAARMGCWKAHWATGPGMGGCKLGAGAKGDCPSVSYPTDAPLLFNVCVDPSEGMPMLGAANGTLKDGKHFANSDPGPTCGAAVPADEVAAAAAKLAEAYRKELATFTHGQLVEPDLLPGEVNATVRICCDKDPFHPPPTTFTCDCDGPPH